MFTPDEIEKFDKEFGNGSAAWIEEVNDYYKVLSGGEELWYSIFGPSKIMVVRDQLRMANMPWTPNMMAYALSVSRMMMSMFQMDVEADLLLRQDTGGVAH